MATVAGCPGSPDSLLVSPAPGTSKHLYCGHAFTRVQTPCLLACWRTQPFIHARTKACTTHAHASTCTKTHARKQSTKTQRLKTARMQAHLFLLNKSLALSLPDYVDGHVRIGEELLYTHLSLLRRHAIGEKAVHVLLTCPCNCLAYLTIIYPYRS